MTTILDKVILVDENDLEIGFSEKLEAHKNGWLHRAFSIFLINQRGEILLQQRAATKYHSPNLWSNSCCSHPMPNESVATAATRRLKEELDVNVPVEHKFQFKYYVEFDNGLVEHEIDHVLIGKYNNLPEINPQEAQAYRWFDLDFILNDVQQNPDIYTFWFKFIMENHCEQLKNAINENL